VTAHGTGAVARRRDRSPLERGSGDDASDVVLDRADASFETPDTPRERDRRRPTDRVGTTRRDEHHGHTGRVGGSSRSGTRGESSAVRRRRPVTVTTGPPGGAVSGVRLLRPNPAYRYVPERHRHDDPVAVMLETTAEGGRHTSATASSTRGSTVSGRIRVAPTHGWERLSVTLLPGRDQRRRDTGTGRYLGPGPDHHRTADDEWPVGFDRASTPTSAHDPAYESPLVRSRTGSPTRFGRAVLNRGGRRRHAVVAPAALADRPTHPGVSVVEHPLHPTDDPVCTGPLEGVVVSTALGVAQFRSAGPASNRR
jgi:hypothetical protein